MITIRKRKRKRKGGGEHTHTHTSMVESTTYGSAGIINKFYKLFTSKQVVKFINNTCGSISGRFYHRSVRVCVLPPPLPSLFLFFLNVLFFFIYFLYFFFYLSIFFFFF